MTNIDIIKGKDKSITLSPSDYKLAETDTAIIRIAPKWGSAAVIEINGVVNTEANEIDINIPSTATDNIEIIGEVLIYAYEIESNLAGHKSAISRGYCYIHNNISAKEA